ncbi:hypothetical protein [Streptomyces sp. CC208A]|uniref:hypothetical protein n=1 Tax=Streptomyces sp. CC208A TaxID=3044573 RepID=UPI0024A9060A|nr:hypothetical protein [Streptomyces sp. CC208A]
MNGEQHPDRADAAADERRARSARREAEETAQHRSKRSVDDAHGSTAKRQTPGSGREEQREPHP